MIKFNAGDKVRIKFGGKVGLSSGSWYGVTGTVIRLTDRAFGSPTYILGDLSTEEHFDDTVEFSEFNLELVEKAKPDYKEGDRIEVTDSIFMGPKAGTKATVVANEDGLLTVVLTTNSGKFKSGSVYRIEDDTVKLIPEPVHPLENRNLNATFNYTTEGTNYYMMKVRSDTWYRFRNDKDKIVFVDKLNEADTFDLYEEYDGELDLI